MESAYPIVAVVHHLAQPFLGHARRALRDAKVVERFVNDGDPLPRLEEVDAIISLGGEQSVLDGGLQDEAELLREAVARDVPVLGVCLGAQVLAQALGGSVARRERRLVAWTPLEPLADDPLLGELPAGAHGLHWNEDGFEPPPGAVELLERPDGGGAEAFRVGRAWGVQFHPEVDARALDGWYAEWGDVLAPAGVSEAQARAADARHLPGQAALSEAIFGAFARLLAHAPA